jgi:hypothetical protein
MGNIIFGIIFIIGGASGYLVLIGTNSSEALIVVGVGMVIWGCISVARSNAKKQQPASPGPKTSTAQINSEADSVGDSAVKGESDSAVPSSVQ